MLDVRLRYFIGQKIRGLLEDPMNEYQDPSWVQAAMLFELMESFFQSIPPVCGHIHVI